MTIKKFFLNLLSSRLEPKIVHSIPGRLRIHFPILKKVPEEFHNDARELLSMVSLIHAINHASVSLITGNLLIDYDYRKISEDDILKAFISLNQLFIHNGDKIHFQADKDIMELKKKLPKFLENLDLQTFNAQKIEKL